MWKFVRPFDVQALLVRHAAAEPTVGVSSGPDASVHRIEQVVLEFGEQFAPSGTK